MTPLLVSVQETEYLTLSINVLLIYYFERKKETKQENVYLELIITLQEQTNNNINTLLKDLLHILVGR